MSSFKTIKIIKHKGKVSKRNHKPSQNLIKSYDHAGLVPRLRTGENQIYQIAQTVDTTYTLTQAAITNTFLGFNFSLDQLAQYSTWTTLFDQYMIDTVQVIIRPQYNAIGLFVPSSVKIPLLYTVIDYDDNTAPTTLTQLKEYSNCNVSMYETVVVQFSPHAALAAYDGSVFTSFANSTRTWIDAAYPGVKHYGVKMGVEGGQSGQTGLQTFDISIKYKVAFRNVH